MENTKRRKNKIILITVAALLLTAIIVGITADSVKYFISGLRPCEASPYGENEEILMFIANKMEEFFEREKAKNSSVKMVTASMYHYYDEERRWNIGVRADISYRIEEEATAEEAEVYKQLYDVFPNPSPFKDFEQVSITEDMIAFRGITAYYLVYMRNGGKPKALTDPDSEFYAGASNCRTKSYTKRVRLFSPWYHVMFYD